MEIAVSIGDCSFLKVLAERKFSISLANFSITALTPDMLEYLLRTFQFEDTSQMDKLLKEALKCERFDNAKILLKHGVSLDIGAALRDAVERAHMKTLEFIVNEYKQEAYRIIQDFLHIAVKNSLVDVIPILLDCGAEVNKEFDGHCLLTLAEDHGVVDLLLSRGANVNMVIDSESFTYPLLWFVSEDFKTDHMLRCQDQVDSAGEESFVNNETVEIVKSLLRHGGRVDVKNYIGDTALHLAFERSNSADIINLLVEAGINVNETDAVVRTALHTAVNNQLVENIPCLIDAGIDLNVIDDMNKTAIFDVRDPRVLELMVQRGADVNVIIRSFIGDTVLLHALLSEFDTPEYVQILIRAGINLNQIDIYDNWALMVAARRMDVDLIKLLVTSGVDMNMSTQVSKNRTVITQLIYSLNLHFQKAKEYISFCLDHGADISMLPPIVIHALISYGCLSLVPKFISFCLAPVHLMVHDKSNVRYSTEFTGSISPLVTALLLNHADVAQYFIIIKYLLRSDISILSGNADFQEHVESKSNAESLEFLERVSFQLLSLETLSFIITSDTLGSDQGRNSKVEKLRLPQMIQDMLMFRNVAEDFIKDSGTKNEFLFLHSLKQYESDDYDDDGDLVNGYVDEVIGND